jgi:NADPH:quinone reductase-like Zn-dependent oxidoreductase
MKRRYKILGYVVVFFAVAITGLGLVLRHTSACPAAATPFDGTNAMQSWRQHCYGGPEVIVLERVPKPAPVAHEVLVKVRAAAANPLDWHSMRGEPYVMRLGTGIGAPKSAHFGVDYSGVVEAVGSAVTRFKAGDEVYGASGGAFSEYIIVDEGLGVAIKPVGLSFVEAAAVPVAALTALQAVRDLGQVKAGQRVLVNGASGGVGTFAVQIARSMGARVTGVCSGRNVELVRALGADQVIDYTKQDFTADGVKYDVIIDTIGNQPPSKLRNVMTESGRDVIVGAPSDGKLLGPISALIKAKLYDPFVSQSFVFFVADMNRRDLDVMSELVQTGQVRVALDKTYAFGEVPEAVRYVETGRARGKVVVTLD